MLDNEARMKYAKYWAKGDKSGVSEILKKEYAPDGLNSYSLLKFCSGRYDSNGNNIFLDSLKEGKLWFASPSTFNDPYDSILVQDCTLEYKSIFNCVANQMFPKNEVDKICQERKYELNKAIQEVNQQISKPMPGSFVCCLTEYSQLSNLPMWAHYANNHAGYCVEYSLSDLKRNHQLTIGPILYSNRIDRTAYPEGEQLRRATINLFFTKSEDWSYEKEWRLFVQDEAKCNQKGFNMDGFKPKHIYIGAQAKEQLIKDICFIAEDIEVPVSQMKLLENSFLLEPERIR